MAELVIANKTECDGFEKYDIIKAYRNGYYKAWKGMLKEETFILRLPLVSTRRVKRRIHSYAGGRREYCARRGANRKNKECATRYFPIWAIWIKKKKK